MSKIESYKDLHVWQTARSLVKEIYCVTRSLPPGERFGLVHQIRRAAVSVPANIAEGYGRSGRKDYVRFLKMARGSLYEIETELMLIEDLCYLSQEQVEAPLKTTETCSRMLHQLIKSLETARPLS